MKRFVTVILLLLAFVVPLTAQTVLPEGVETLSFLEQWYASVAAMSAIVAVSMQLIKPLPR